LSKTEKQKTLKELEDWLLRLEQPRAGSIWDNHCELGMMYVLRKLLGKDTEDLEKQALKWRDRVFKANYDRIDVANFKKGLVAEIQKRKKELEAEHEIFLKDNADFEAVQTLAQIEELNWVLKLLGSAESKRLE